MKYEISSKIRENCNPKGKKTCNAKGLKNL